MKKPYFYIIQHVKSKLYYAGVRYSSKCDSSELLCKSGYTTSSKLVIAMIAKDGLEAFIVLRIKHFDSAHDAILYERRFLKKVNAHLNTAFLNASNNEGGIAFSQESLKNIMLHKYGVEFYSQTQEFKDKFKKTCLDNYGTTHPLQNKSVIEKIKKTCLEKYGTEHATQSDIVKNKTKSTCYKKYGTTWFDSKEFKDKRAATMIKRYGVTSSTATHKEAMKATSGENHHRFSGYYVTPTGKFASAYLAAAGTPETTRKNIARFCMNPDVKISKGQYVKVAYLQNNYDLSIIGKTFRELGFWFEPLEPQ